MIISQDLKQLTALLFCLIFFQVFSGCMKGDSSGIPAHIAGTENLVILADDPAPLFQFHLEFEYVFEDSLLLDEISSVLTDTHGRLFLAGERWSKRQVHIFEPDGTYRDSLGNKGKDFGEFQSIDRMQILDNHLIIFDETLSRITRYHLGARSWADTTSVKAGLNHSNGPDLERFTPLPAAVFDDGSSLFAFRKKRNPAYEPDGIVQFYRSGSEGTINPEKLMELRDTFYLVGDYAGRPAPFTLKIPERPLFEKSVSGDLYFAHTDEFFIRMLNRDGEQKAAFYYPYERKQLDPDEVIHPRFSHNDQLLRIRNSAEYPETWPALYSMVPDDENRLWISTITDNRSELEWWVLDIRTGTVLTRFTWPFSRSIRHISNGSVYTVEQNSMGFSVVVKYSFTAEYTKSSGENQITQMNQGFEE